MRYLDVFLMVTVSTFIFGSEALDVEFKSISVPQNTNAKNILQATDEIEINGKKQRIDFHKLIQTGYQDNGEVYGQLKGYRDNPLVLNKKKPYICNGTSNPYGSGSGLDHVTILQKNEKLYMVSQFECQVGAYYINELEQDPKSGTLQPKSNSLRFISQSDEFGGYVHCAGMKTPWESHLGSEEYPADASKRKKGGEIDLYYNYVKAYWGDLKVANPYYYGWIPEVKVDDGGKVHYTKHYSMGRFSHELAYVMPDRKTVYMTDDGLNTGFFMYLAKRAEDLSEGTLFAAKWHQKSSENGGSADISWIKLGEANDKEIREMLDPDHNTSTNDGLTFEDIFETGETSKKCQEGFTAINTESGYECLRIKKGMHKAAAFLESRRYAAMVGATTEFRKGEGITFDASNNRLYVSMSEIAKGMEDFAKKGKKESRYDQGGHNDIRLSYNPCGGIYVLNIDNAYKAVDMKAVLVGKPVKGLFDNSCDVDSIANPDNLTFITDSNKLIIGEDSSFHENNMVWVYDTKTQKLSRIITLPQGAEATSPFWYNDINGFGYLLLVTQHPDVKSKDTGESSVGVLGPIRGHK